MSSYFLQEKVKSFGINEENMFTFWDVSEPHFLTLYKAFRYQTMQLVEIDCFVFWQCFSI